MIAPVHHSQFIKQMTIPVYRQNHKICNKYKALKYITITKYKKNCIVYADLRLAVLLYDTLTEHERLHIHDLMFSAVPYVQRTSE